SEADPDSTGPLLLKGLTVSADDRLNTVTLVGEPRDVQVATSLLTQMDARRRQVAVNVKVVDVTLTNDQSFSSNFSFGSDDAFIVQDDGAAILRFGGFSPVSGDDLNSAPGRVINPPVINNPLLDGNTFVDFERSIIAPGQGGGLLFLDDLGNLIRVPQDARFFGRVAGVSMDPTIAGITDITPGEPDTFQRTFDPETGITTTTITPGTIATATSALPSFFQFPRRFLAQIETNIQSGNAKVLTDPTLVVQEGQEATVKLTQKVIENITTQVDPLSGVRTTTPVLQDAGLTLAINVDKIDDNGYINLTVSPTIAAVGDVQVFDSGADGGTNQLFLLNRRELSSGLIRLRDGQTLILSGIISESDQSTTSKVPLLGDIPLLGALFRSQTDTSQRTEVIVLLTPQILHDNGQWGYNYQPGRGTAEVLRDQGFPVQLVP
ncbi:MAG: secretin N-terminal domain-containing protein, partial [Crocosphaera sp.]